MNNIDNDVFEFGNNPNEESTNFNYGNISGLGESNYENEDLFSNIPPIDNNVQNNNVKFDNGFGTVDYDLASDTSLNDLPTLNNNNNIMDSITESSAEEVKEETPVEQQVEETIEEQPVEQQVEEVPVEQPVEEIKEEPIHEIPTVVTDSTIEPIPEVIPEVTEPAEDLNSVTMEDVFELPTEENNNQIPEMKTIETPTIEEVTEEETPEIEMSETPIEDLQKLTEYEEDNIDSTNINSLFDKLSVNVKDASEIFRKNTNLKEKIDTRFEELKKLQSELENSRRKQMEEIDKYRDEVLDKLSEKKAEIEKRLNVLKDLQATLEKEKTEFEEYKRKEQANISKVQKEVQSAYDERREELEHIEDVLRKQKDSLDEERNQLSLDKIQYEADKNDLANNLLKFNQIVNSFTNGIEMKPETTEE